MTENLKLAIGQGELLYRQLFDSHPQAMWVFDPETLGFLMVNDAATTRYGYSVDCSDNAPR